MADLLPSSVHVVEATKMGFPVEPLLGPEVAAAAPMAPRRAAQFAAGRTLAHRCLRAIGVAEVAVGVGSHGEPVWPRGVIGSITHAPGYMAVAAARGGLKGIGIDAESHLPIHEQLSEEVCTLSELDWIGSASVHAGVVWLVLFFSAKESFYKAWFPLNRKWLDFKDVEINVDPSAQTFTASIVKADLEFPTGTSSGSGRYLVDDGLVMTAVVLGQDHVCPTGA